ncbi:hypothetical protein [Curtobacterium sp. 260]|nr:hypothetical protein [Curtobacterium sp. 260]MDP9737376.1 hypothetical protein [Curtobacterium sp. 260]
MNASFGVLTYTRLSAERVRPVVVRPTIDHRTLEGVSSLALGL